MVAFDNIEDGATYHVKLLKPIKVGPAWYRPDQQNIMMRGELLQQLIQAYEGAFDPNGTEKVG